MTYADEGHRLKCRKNLSSYKFHDEACAKLGLSKDATQLDWILKQTKCAIVFYDKDQLVFPAGLEIDKIMDNDPLDNRPITFLKLTSQMRCQGGISYLSNLREVLHNNLKHKFDCANYELKIIDNFTLFEEVYDKKEKDNGLTRMLAGYAWKWKSKNNKKNHTNIKDDIVIEGHEKKWNSCLENWVHSADAVNEVGCIHSTQGYDLNYGFVILGNDIKFDVASQRVVADRENYFDVKGKDGATDEEIEEYIKNIYYVLMSRGIKGTYLYVCDSELKKYLSKFIDVMK